MKITEYKLADLLITLENGGRPAGGVSSITSGIPSVGGEHLTADGGFDFSKVKYVPEEYFKNMQRGHIQTDDILIVKDGATTGKVSFVTRDFPFKKAAVNEHVFILRVNKDKVLSKLLFYNLFSPPGQKQILANYRGAAIGGINQGFTQNTIIPLPPMSEQERIVRLLDEAVSLRALRVRANERTDEFHYALFATMFGNPVTNSMNWKVDILGNLGDGKNGIVDGPFGSSVNTSVDYISNGEIPVIRSKNIRPFRFDVEDLKFITREKFNTIDRSRVVPGDIVFVKVGANIGDVCIFPKIYDEAVLSTTGSCKITPDNEKVDTVFLTHYLYYLKSSLQELSLQAAQPFLNMKHIKNIQVILPPLALQREFAARVEEARGVQSAQGKSAERVEALYQSMLSRAFAGEL